MQRTSKQHKQLREILSELFFQIKIQDEYAIKWQGKAYLIDVYAPQINMAFEIQGRQHSEYVPFMHKCRDNFSRQKKLDVEKIQACIANNIRLVYIYHTDKLTKDFILSIIERDDHDRIVTNTSD